MQISQILSSSILKLLTEHIEMFSLWGAICTYVATHLFMSGALWKIIEAFENQHKISARKRQVVLVGRSFSFATTVLAAAISGGFLVGFILERIGEGGNSKKFWQGLLLAWFLMVFYCLGPSSKKGPHTTPLDRWAIATADRILPDSASEGEEAKN
jgi:hypothetical protein